MRPMPAKPPPLNVATTSSNVAQVDGSVESARWLVLGSYGTLVHLEWRHSYRHTTHCLSGRSSAGTPSGLHGTTGSGRGPRPRAGRGFGSALTGPPRLSSRSI